jgi:hypothetical protein
MSGASERARMLAELHALQPAIMQRGFALAVEADAKAPPAKIQVGATGEWVTHPMGEFELGAEPFEEAIANFNAAGVMPCVDREHECWFSFDDKAGARGWVTKFSIEPDARNEGKPSLWASIDWTDEGADDVMKRRFLYVSGGYLLKAKDRKTGKPIGCFVDHVSIVKRPFIQNMQPLLNSFLAGGGRLIQEDPMSKVNQELAAMLGLAADASEEKILEALAKQKEKFATGQPAPAVTAVEQRVAQLEGGQIEAMVDTAIAAFKVTPAERPELVALGKEGATGRARLERMLASRTPHKPGPDDVQTGQKSKTQDTLEQQGAAIRTWLAANPAANPADAVRALKATKPELFPAGLIPGVL